MLYVFIQPLYWIDQKVCSGFSIRFYRITQTNVFANLIYMFLHCFSNIAILVMENVQYAKALIIFSVLDSV